MRGLRADSGLVVLRTSLPPDVCIQRIRERAFCWYRPRTWASAAVEASFHGPDDRMFSIVKLIPFGRDLWINRAEGMLVQTESGTEVLLRFHRNAWRTLAPLFALAWVAVWSAVYLTNPAAAETVPPWLAVAMGPGVIAFLEWRSRALAGDDKEYLVRFLQETLRAKKVDNPA